MNMSKTPPSDILVIDDNPAELEQILESISRLGRHADSAVEIADGARLFSTGSYRLVLIGGHSPAHEIPSLDVPAIVQRLRAIEAGRPGMPASSIFAWASPQDTHAGRRNSDAGVTACLPRPDSPAGWREAVVSCIGYSDMNASAAGVPEMATDGSEPPLDVSALEQLCGGDMAMAREIVELYLATNEEDVRTLDAAIAAGNAQAVKTASHRMKGAAQILGAAAVARLCQAIESAAADAAADWTFIGAQHERLQIERNRLAQFMAQRLGTG